MKIGIAFGGGGARGLAHIHVIRALEELGLEPVIISGTSIGSIMGAGYSAGMAAQDIEDFVLETFSNPTEILSRFWSMRPGSVGEVFSGPRTMLGNIDPKKAIRAFTPEQLPSTFEELKIPFHAVATEFYGQHEVVLSTGNLKEAIAASSALPAVFQPVFRDGHTLVDGGIVNAVPYEILFDKSDFVIAVDVVGGPKKSKKKLPTRVEALAGASQLMMQATTRLKCKIMPPDVMIVPPVNGIGVLDFIKSKSILDSTASIKEDAKRSISEALDEKAKLSA